MTKLEKKEEEDYKKYDDKAQKGLDKNNELSDKIVDDVDSRKEERASNKIGRNNEKVKDNLDKRDALASNVDQTYIHNTLLKEQGTKAADGCMYRRGTNPMTGNTFYMKDGIQITEEEYNLATASATLA